MNTQVLEKSEVASWKSGDELLAHLLVDVLQYLLVTCQLDLILMHLYNRSSLRWRYRHLLLRCVLGVEDREAPFFIAKNLVSFRYAIKHAIDTLAFCPWEHIADLPVLLCLHLLDLEQLQLRLLSVALDLSYKDGTAPFKLHLFKFLFFEALHPIKLFYTFSDSDVEVNWSAKQLKIVTWSAQQPAQEETVIFVLEQVGLLVEWMDLGLL